MQSPSNGGWFKVIYILSFKHVNVIEKIILWQHHLAVLVTNNSWLHISSISCSALYTLFLTSPVLGLAGSLCCMSVSVSACVSVTIFSTSYRVGNQVFLGVGLWEFSFYRAGLQMGGMEMRAGYSLALQTCYSQIWLWIHAQCALSL